MSRRMTGIYFYLVVFTWLGHVTYAQYERIKPRSVARIPCRIRPLNREDVNYLKDSMMYTFEVSIYNETMDPLRKDVSPTYKPWKYYRTLSDHGKTLLTLSFNYDVLSLTILTIGVQHVHLKLKDFPIGCFANLTAKQRVDIIRDKAFDNFKRRKRPQLGEDGMLLDEEESSVVVYVCNEVIRDNGGYAEFANRCCARDNDGKVTCSEHEDNYWITVLYVCIALVKLMLFMFSPLLVPSHMYTASYLASEYVVKLTKELKMKMFVSESATTSVRYKNRLTFDDVSEWRRFLASIEQLPRDEICHVKVPELRIKVKGKRIIPANEPPTGLLRTMYDNLIRCKIRSIDPFKECCNASIYAALQPFIKHKCTWETLVLVFIKVVVLVLLPFPFYIRVFIYYKFEEEELLARKDMIDKLGLQQAFHPYRMNIIQYLTPTHRLFIATYVFYLVSGLVLGFASSSVREKLQSIARSAFHDMQSVSRTNVLQVVLGFLLWPFKRFGLIALITCPIFTILSAPAWIFVFVLYCVPTVYLSFRLLYHCRKKLGSEDSIFESDKPMNKAKQKAFIVHKKLVKIDKGVHVKRQAMPDEEKANPCMYGYGRLHALRRLLLQIIVGGFLLVILFSSVLLFVEAAGVLVEVLAFTMMGIIVNAGSTLRYVSMALLVIVYMHNCYDNVYDNYLTFNTTIVDDVMDRVEDLKKIASLPSSMQENAAFQVKTVEAVDEIPTVLNLEKKDPQWRIGHLLLFFDSFDTPRIPLNLFKKVCEIRVHGAPGPVYINLLKATGKFSIIVVFLFFVMIVVMAFGSAHQMSSTNQTLATLAGGFVPMLLKNVLTTKSTKLNLKTLSFKGQIDEIIADYKQNWPIYDLAVEQYDPNAEEEQDTDKDKDNKDDNKSDDSNKNEKEDNKDKESHSEKHDDEEKEKDFKDTKDSEKALKSMLGSTMASLQPPDPFHDSTEDLRPLGVVSGPTWLRRLSVAPPEDNLVDLFIDMSANQAASAWQWQYGSSETLHQSMSMLNEFEMAPSDSRMPYNQNGIDMDNIKSDALQA